MSRQNAGTLVGPRDGIDAALGVSQERETGRPVRTARFHALSLLLDALLEALLSSGFDQDPVAIDEGITLRPGKLEAPR